jgi:hypothetical protein
MSEENSNVDMSKFSAEQTLALEEIRARRIEAEAKASENERVVHELQKENRDSRFALTVRSEIEASGIRFYPSSGELVKLLSAEPGTAFHPSADGGEIHAEKNGKTTTFRELLEDFAIRNPQMVSEASNALLKSDPKLVKSRADLTSNEEKSAYIQRNGARAYENLPVQRIANFDESKCTASEWRALTPSRKAEYIGQGADVDRILMRKG